MSKFDVVQCPKCSCTFAVQAREDGLTGMILAEAANQKSKPEDSKETPVNGTCIE